MNYPSRFLLAGFAVLTLILAALLTPHMYSNAPQTAQTASFAADHRSPLVSGSLYSALAAAETGQDAAYAIHTDRGLNPAQHFGVQFDAAGARVALGSGAQFDLTLTAYGYGANLQAVRAVTPQISANRVEYRHGPLTEWYVNTARGLEQGFTLQTPPNDARRGALTLRLATGTMTATLAANGQSITLADAQGGTLDYGQLSVTDAAGRPVPAWLAVNRNAVEMRLDDSQARYPLTVDPYTLQQKLTQPGTCEFGYSAALSSDGNTALVGSVDDNGGVGAAYVFSRSGSIWTLQQKLTQPGTSNFGSSVALSSDGNTALVGSEGDNSYVGAAYVFTRSGSIWTLQQQLTQPPPQTSSAFRRR